MAITLKPEVKIKVKQVLDKDKEPKNEKPK